jgi:hypothetical protein
MREIRRVAPTSPRIHSYNTRGNAAAIEARAHNLQVNVEAAAVGSTVPGQAANASDAFDWRNSTLLVEFKRNSGMDPFKSLKALKGNVVDVEDEKEEEGSDVGDEEETHSTIEVPKTPDNLTATEDAKSTDDSSSEPLIFFEKESVKSKYTLGQLAIYANEMFGHQQRTHIFQLFIAGRTARFIFFDHSGAVVTDAINYVQDSKLLVEFFWRLNHMSKVARGWDPTARQPASKDIAVFKKVINAFLEDMNKPNSSKRRLPNAEHTLSAAYDVHKMLVTDSEDESNSMELLVQGPMFKATTALGRFTRGYLAVPINASVQDEPLFLKDTWRVNHHMMETEAEVYKLLEKYGVPHVPRLICGGDVIDENGNVQKTISADWAEKQKLKISYEPLRRHSHHRIVQRVAYPIESAENSKEFVEAFLDVFESKS